KPLYEKLEKSDYTFSKSTLYNQYLEFIWNIGVCVNEGLILGAPRSDGTYDLELERNITLREAMNNVLRLKEKTKKNIFMPAMLETDYYHDDTLYPSIHEISEVYTEELNGNDIQSYYNSGNSSSGDQQAFYGALNFGNDNFIPSTLDSDLLDILQNQYRKKSYLQKTNENSSFLTLYSNQSYKLSLNTKIPEKYYNYVSYGWTSLTGKLSSLSKEINDQGNLMPSVIFKTPMLLTEKVIPLIVFAVVNDGTTFQKDFYVRIKPYPEQTTSAEDDKIPGGQCSAYFQKESEEFVISCCLNENTDHMKINYSFDFSVWNQIYDSPINADINIKRPFTIDNSQKHSHIYFKVDLENTSNSNKQTLQTISLTYEPIIESAEQITKRPDQPVLNIIRDSSITNSVKLEWLDSYIKDNVTGYEIQYDDSPLFDQPIEINIDNPATGDNKNEKLFYTLTELQDDETYYIRLRGVNNSGHGNWSNIIRVLINIPDYPVFMDVREPENHATNVSKQPFLIWKTHDSDHDRMDYKVIIGTSPDNLDITLRHFDDTEHEGEEMFDFSTEYYKALHPDTTYYWQVWINEKGFYKGSYTKSPIWSFTTVNTRPDIIITDAIPIDPIEPDQLVRFKLKVKNQGAEPTEYHCLSAYYIKNGKQSPFKYVKGCLYDLITSNETKEIEVSIRFYDGIIEHDNVVYDNVLTSVESKIRFIISSNVLEDSQNNTFDYVVKYENAGSPEIEYFNLREYNDMYPDHKSDYFVRKGGY
ncbi:hypothetical protein MHK_001516, partial [Candidatus Magnetomorum sp. HK-1]